MAESALLTRGDLVADLLDEDDRPVEPMAVLDQQLASLKETLRLCIVYAGSKDDPEKVIRATANFRHWKSYKSVAEDIAQALRNVGFKHISTMADGMDLPNRLRAHRIDMVWCNTGGVQGQCPVCHTPAMLEMLGLPSISHNPFNAALLDNKHSFKLAMLGVGIPTTPFIVWDPSRQGVFRDAEHDRFDALFADWPESYVVKPVNGRASQYVYFVDRRSELDSAVAECWRNSGCMVMIEPFLSGREYCVAVCGPIVARDGRLQDLGKPFVFSPVERVLDADEPVATSMDMRPITAERIRLLDPATEPQEIAQLEELARRVFQEFQVETLIRLDVRADHRGRMNVLEVNPKPDLARPAGNKISIVCKGLEQQGMTYEDLVVSILADRWSFLKTHRGYAVEHIRCG